MSSPTLSPREMHSSTTGVTPQASVTGPPAAHTSQSSASVDTPAPVPPMGSQTSNSPSNHVSGSVKESGQTKFATAPSYVVDPPSFSYGVIPKPVTSSGSSKEISSTPDTKSNPPTSDAALQPPVPVQSPTHSPSFSYTVVTSSNLVSSSGQQLQPSSETGSGRSQGGKSSTPTASSLQLPVPGNPGHSNSYSPGIAPQKMPDPVHSPVPVPKGGPSIAAGFSFSRPSMLPAALDASHRDPSSYSNTPTTAVREAGMSALPLSGSQNVAMPAHPSSSSSTISHTTSNLFPATMWMAAAPSFHSNPGMVGCPPTPGPPGIAPSVSFTSPSAVRPMGHPMPLTPPLPPNLAAQQQSYPPFQSLPSMAPLPQAHWLQSPQIVGMQRHPYLPFPAVINPLPLPARGLVLPSVSLPESQPPGVSPVGPQGEIPSSSAGSVQHVKSSEVQSELPPPGTDHDKKADSNGDPVNEVLAAWTAHKTDTGAVYYYNAMTGESTYEKPHGFKGEPDKVTVQSTPVSSEKLAGTDWVLVTTSDEKKYYYNTKTKVSSWQIPMEVTEMTKKKHEEDILRSNMMSVQSTSTLPDKDSTSISLSTPAVNSGGRDAAALRPVVLPGSSSALDLIKRKLQDSGIPATTSSVPATSGPSTSDANGLTAVDATNKGQQEENNRDKPKDSYGDGHLSDSSSDSEDVDTGPTKEECIIQFKEMLKERGVAPFSKWEKELPKIVFDPRFQAVPSHSTRRSLFEHFVRTRAEEERKEKRAAQKAAVEGFRQLLDAASEDIDHKTDYQSFKRKWGSDPRFEALDRKERDTLLNERVLPLKRASEEKIRAIREAAYSGFKSMLRDKRDINVNTRWSKVKGSLRDDPRYKSVKHDEREILFNEYISELRNAEEEVDRAAKGKREEQDKLKEREREMRKRKEKEEEELERVRIKVRRKEALSSYQALLVETIKDPQASWSDSKLKLEKDPQGRATNSDLLDQAEIEKLFREHVKTLYERCVREYQNLLAQVISSQAASEPVTEEDGKNALTSWSTAKRLLKSDPRYMKIDRKDRESLWRRYAAEIYRKRKTTATTELGDKTTRSPRRESGKYRDRR